MPGSALPAIVWRQLMGEPPPVWLPGAQALVLAAGLPLLARLNGANLLRGFVAALGAMQLGFLLANLIRETRGYAEWTSGAPAYQDIFVAAFVLLIPGLLMLLTAVADGLGPRDLFLQKGEVAALSRIPATRRWISWRLLGPLLVAGLTVPLAVQLVSANDVELDRLGTAVSLLPVALVFGAINAWSEEVRFRCVLLARLAPVVGVETSIWMTALSFGLAHWYGANPSGPSGVAMTTAFGLILAKSMFETRGLFWAWTMHGAADMVIFTVLVMAAP